MPDLATPSDEQIVAWTLCRLDGVSSGGCQCAQPQVCASLARFDTEARLIVGALRARDRLLVTTPPGPPPRQRGAGELGAP